MAFLKQYKHKHPPLQHFASRTMHLFWTVTFLSLFINWNDVYRRDLTVTRCEMPTCVKRCCLPLPLHSKVSKVERRHSINGNLQLVLSCPIQTLLFRIPISGYLKSQKKYNLICYHCFTVSNTTLSWHLLYFYLTTLNLFSFK